MKEILKRTHKNLMIIEACFLYNKRHNLNLTEEEKEKTFTRDEVIALCRRAHLHGEQGALNLHDGTCKEWIEENL